MLCGRTLSLREIGVRLYIDVDISAQSSTQLSSALRPLPARLFIHAFHRAAHSLRKIGGALVGSLGQREQARSRLEAALVTKSHGLGDLPFRGVPREKTTVKVVSPKMHCKLNIAWCSNQSNNKIVHDLCQICTTNPEG